MLHKRIKRIDFPERLPEKFSTGVRVGKCPMGAFPRNIQIRDKRFQLVVRNLPKSDPRKDKRVEHGIRIDGYSHLGEGISQKLCIEQRIVRDYRIISQKFPDVPGD